MIKLKITTHSGNDYEAIVEEYNPEQVNADLNTNEINTVMFGDIILSRIDVKSVVPVGAEEEEAIEEEVGEQEVESPAE